MQVTQVYESWHNVESFFQIIFVSRYIFCVLALFNKKKWLLFFDQLSVSISSYDANFENRKQEHRMRWERKCNMIVQYFILSANVNDKCNIVQSIENCRAAAFAWYTNCFCHVDYSSIRNWIFKNTRWTISLNTWQFCNVNI